MKTLRSYLSGRWSEGSGAPQTLVNPATEEPLAQVSSDGLDPHRSASSTRRKEAVRPCARCPSPSAARC